MSLYTSGKVHHDPEPYRTRFPTLIRHRHPAWAPLAEDCIYGPGCEYAPRPEYDNHNPILVDFRREAEALGRSYPKDWLRVCKPWFWPDGFDTHIAHARRVLTKLASLTTTPNGVTD